MIDDRHRATRVAVVGAGNVGATFAYALLLSGLAAEIVLIDANRQKTVVPRDRIDAVKPSAVSLMPEGLLDKLRDDQVRDLFRYLQSSGPPRE